MTSKLTKVAIVAILILFTIFYTCFITSGKENTPIYVDETIVLNGGTYDVEIKVIVTQDAEKALQFVIENVDMPVTLEDFEASGVTFADEEGNIVIWLDNTEDHGVISHELLHATFSIMLWAGIPLNDTTEESYTYQLQYLTNQFYNKLK
jgi:hypothetical protein